MNPFKGIGIVALCLLFMVGIGKARSLAPGASAAQKAASVASEKDTGDRSDTPPYAFHLLRNGKIDATIENRGIFGNAYLSGSLEDLCVAEACQSFETPVGSGLEYLFAGSVWIGGIVVGDTLVTVAADGWLNIQETVPVVTGTGFAGPAVHSVWTLFTDTAAVQSPYDPNVHTPLNLRIANRAYLWDGDPENNAIVYDMVITNIGEHTVEQGYIGFYFDADVYYSIAGNTGYNDDLTGSLRETGIAYIIDNDGDPQEGLFGSTSPTKAFAFRFLQTSFPASDTSYNWWIPNTTPTYDFGPMAVDEYGNPICDFGGHTGYPDGDEAKYCLLSHAGWDYDQIFTDTIPGWMPPPLPSYADDLINGYDTRFLMSIGPFNLLPDSSVRILFTTFTGESVHQVTDNMNNLPDNPEQYLANLDFSHLTANAVTADAMGGTLLDPALAVTGLYARHNDRDSVAVEWDPWGFGDVEGYDIFLYEVQADDLPYPGVVPPWLKPPAQPPVATVGRTYHHAFTGLNKYHSYLVNVANRYGGTTGDIGQPLIVQAGGMAPAPIPENDYIFIPEGKGYPVTLSWTAPPDVEVDHFNIYRFANPAMAGQKYYPRYDTGEFQDSVAARDSFLVDGVRYYYYAMTPYAQANSWQTSFSELANDSTVYMITAVDPTGLESAFSIDVPVLVVPEKNRDILVLTCSQTFSGNYVYPDTLAAFYQRILPGYSFDIYRWRDTIRAYHGPNGYYLKGGWWYDLMRYRLVIVDDGFAADAVYDISGVSYGETVSGLEKFLLYGGRLAYCGSFPTLHTFTSPAAAPAYYPVDHPFVQRFFGVDSVFRIGIGYYINPTNPTVRDYLTGMIEAVSAGSPVPNVGYDTLQNPFFWVTSGTFWPPNTVASPSVYVLNDKGQTIQTLRSRCPETSLVDGLPVGIRTETDEATTYLYGYHLWLMNDLDARALVDYMINDTAAFSIAATVVEPDTMFAMFANAIDVRPGRVYVAYEDSQYTVADVDPSSILINGVIGPLATEIVSDPEIPGGEALAADIDLRPFVAGYLPAWDTTVQTYTVTGALTDGTPLALQGNFILVGHISGDANGDQAVTIGDAVFVVNYVFRDGPAPSLTAAADANADGKVDLGDAVCLVNFIFRGGVRPQHP